MSTPPEDSPDFLFNAPLEIDEEEIANAGNERGKVLDISDELRVLAKENRLTLFKTKASRRKLPSGSWLASTELQFQSHAHPQCHFVEASLAVSLAFTPGAKVTQLQPERAMVHQVKVTEATKPGIEAEIPGIGIKASIGGEKTSEQSFEQPVLTGYNGEDRAIWTFRAPASLYELSLNVPLLLTVEYPGTTDILRAQIQISARVAARGWKELIPLFGAKSGEGESAVYLDR